MTGAWVSSYYLNTEGFPKILYVTLQKLRVKDCPEYEGREYESMALSGVKLPSTLERVRSSPASLKPEM